MCEREGAQGSECVCVCVRERERECVCVCLIHDIIITCSG